MEKNFEFNLLTRMDSIQSLLNQYPANPRESAQGYARRLLRIAMQRWTLAIFKDAERIVVKEAEEKTGEYADACSNILIELHQIRKMQMDLLGLP